MGTRQPFGPAGFLLLAVLLAAFVCDVAGAQTRWPPWQSYGEAETSTRAKQKRRAIPKQSEIDALNKQVEQLSQAGKQAEAIAAAKRALSLTEQRHGRNHAATATALTTLAELLIAEKRYAEAEPLLKRALAIREKSKDADKDDVAKALDNLAKLYEGQGRKADAQQLKERAGAAGEAQAKAEADAKAKAEAERARLAEAEAKRAAESAEGRKADAEAKSATAPEKPEEQTAYCKSFPQMCGAEDRSSDQPPPPPPKTTDNRGVPPADAREVPQIERPEKIVIPEEFLSGPPVGASRNGGGAAPEAPASNDDAVGRSAGEEETASRSSGTAPPDGAPRAPDSTTAPPPAASNGQGAPPPQPITPGGGTGGGGGGGGMPGMAQLPPGTLPTIAPTGPPLPPGTLPTIAPTAPPPVAAAPPVAPPPVAAPAAGPAAQEKWDVVPVFYGTDRAVEPNAKRLSYGSDRGRRLELGQALVTVPKLHEVPEIERPWAIRIPYFDVTIYEEAEDPNKHFTMKELKALPKEQLLKLVRERLDKSKKFRNEALVFVHGYNTSFDNAIYRTAQITYDLKFDGAPFLYSWPSGGGLTSYTYDRENAGASKSYMRKFLDMVVKESGAKSVSIIAHSMGNEPLLEVLNGMKSSVPEGIVISQIILAAPDVDADTFGDLTAAIKGLARGVTLYAAANDRALAISRKVWGDYRAGDVPPGGPLVLPDIDTIDVTAASTDAFATNHSSYAQNNDLLKDIAELIETGKRPPEDRILKHERVTTDHGAYWKYATHPPSP